MIFMDGDEILISGPYDMVARKLNNGDKVVSSNMEDPNSNKNSEGFSVTIN